MSERLTYWKYWILSKIGNNNQKRHYRYKKRQARKELFYKKSGVLGHTLRKIEDYQAYQKFYLLFKQRFNIDIPADVCGFGNFFELIHIPLKKMSCFAADGSPVLLKECAQYKYLVTRDEGIYLEYLAFLKKKEVMSEYGKTWSLERFKNLEKELVRDGYQPEKSIIVVNQDNFIYDGTHRSSVLLYKYGEDYEIPVIQVSRQ